MHVGFIGLGSQGGPMARRIVDAGYPTTLWARRPDSLTAFADTPAKIASTPSELGAASDVVGICVVDDADVEEVVAGEQGVLAGMPDGGVIVVHSTIHPDTCHRLSTLAGARDIRLIDAPVSGGGAAAAEGRLLVMVGGDAEAVEYCRPVFATYADPIVHLGPLGSGQLTKLLNNVLFTANLATAAGAITLGTALDVDPANLAEVMSHGSGSSFALDRIAPAGTLDRIAQHGGQLLTKDVRLMSEIVEAQGVSGDVVMAAADAALEIMAAKRAAGEQGS